MRHLYFLIRLTSQTKGSHRMILDNQLTLLQTSYRRLDFLKILTRYTKEIQILREERISKRPSQIILQLAMILRITILSNDLNSETSVSYASCENCVKNENCANSDPQENSLPCQWLSAKPKAGSSASQFVLFRHYCPIRS